MVEDSIESRQSDQDEDSDECPPDDIETRRIEEVNAAFAILGSVAHPRSFPPTRATYASFLDSS